jgi:hypothetical protein
MLSGGSDEGNASAVFLFAWSFAKENDFGIPRTDWLDAWIEEGQDALPYFFSSVMSAPKAA